MSIKDFFSGITGGGRDNVQQEINREQSRIGAGNWNEKLNELVARRDNPSLGSRLSSGIRSLGLNVTGDPTPAALEAQRRFMANVGSDGGGSGGPATMRQPDMSDIYAENLRRYNEYMESQGPAKPDVTPEMRQAALGMFESQQGAGQMPYYMAAGLENNQEMSPAFKYAAQNYDVLGGSQRLAPRPMEMMSVAERRQINDMAQAMADQQAAENEYQKGMNMVMRGGGKGGGATIPQGNPMMPTNLPPNFGSMLASRFGRMY